MADGDIVDVLGPEFDMEVWYWRSRTVGVGAVVLAVSNSWRCVWIKVVGKGWLVDGRFVVCIDKVGCEKLFV